MNILDRSWKDDDGSNPNDRVEHICKSARRLSMDGISSYDLELLRHDARRMQEVGRGDDSSREPSFTSKPLRAFVNNAATTESTNNHQLSPKKYVDAAAANSLPKPPLSKSKKLLHQSSKMLSYDRKRHFPFIHELSIVAKRSLKNYLRQVSVSDISGICHY